MLVRVSRPRSTRHFSRLFFAPAGHHLNVFLTCAHRMRVHFCPQHWLLCHLGLYKFEFEFEFDTLPITKKNKHTVVTEAPKKSTCAAFALANLLQKANSGSSWHLSSEQFGGTEHVAVCTLRGTSLFTVTLRTRKEFLPCQGLPVEEG